ncbi:Coatomer/clathrin adaptor appendage, Ig-like subdomain [Pseudocohnilembus persalinus]|uniref:Coatomer/clathrin adaptor appendage, Ig-like subdomain n=1 Tax=Pseudocohnilembus persalinus TaxID=266149 RepID=A0A0V0QXF6_PSEPJ|nr:Coatomer/clathrin adaptor appendage, Ig-like subdomain [Pseudocohnilembus persalinus]|eukprot:KRX06600.1 Coatomer/clathrin adaptor appendage, Ig-like subdomain [Pseudocohnilembus persalinus]
MEEYIDHLRQVFRLGQKQKDLQSQQLKQYLQQKPNEEVQQSAVQAILQCFQDEKDDPYSKLVALRFLTQCMKVYGGYIYFHQLVEKFLQETLFNYFMMLAGDTEENFGHQLFEEYSDKVKDPKLFLQIKKTFAAFLSYDVATLWKEQFPDSDQHQFKYEELYDNLMEMGVNLKIGEKLKTQKKNAAQSQKQNLQQSQVTKKNMVQSTMPQQQQQQLYQEGKQQIQATPDQNQNQQQQQASKQQLEQINETPQGVSQSQKQVQTKKVMYQRIEQLQEMIEMIIEDPGSQGEFMDLIIQDANELNDDIMKVEDMDDEQFMNQQISVTEMLQLLMDYQKKQIDQNFVESYKEIKQAGPTPQGQQQQQQQQKQQQQQTRKPMQQQDQIEDEEEKKFKQEQEELQRQMELQKQKELKEAEEKQKLLQQKQKEEQEKERQLQIQIEQQEKLLKEQKEKEKQLQIQAEKQKKEEEMQEQMRIQKLKEEQEQQEKQRQYQIQQQQLQQQQKELEEKEKQELIQKQKQIEQQKQLQKEQEEQEQERKFREEQERQMKEEEEKIKQYQQYSQQQQIQQHQIDEDQDEDDYSPQQKKQNQQQQNQHQQQNQQMMPQSQPKKTLFQKIGGAKGIQQGFNKAHGLENEQKLNQIKIPDNQDEEWDDGSIPNDSPIVQRVDVNNNKYNGNQLQQSQQQNFQQFVSKHQQPQMEGDEEEEEEQKQNLNQPVSPQKQQISEQSQNFDRSETPTRIKSNLNSQAIPEQHKYLFEQYRKEQEQYEPNFSDDDERVDEEGPNIFSNQLKNKSPKKLQQTSNQMQKLGVEMAMQNQKKLSSSNISQNNQSYNQINTELSEGTKNNKIYNINNQNNNNINNNDNNDKLGFQLHSQQNQLGSQNNSRLQSQSNLTEKQMNYLESRVPLNQNIQPGQELQQSRTNLGAGQTGNPLLESAINNKNYMVMSRVQNQNQGNLQQSQQNQGLMQSKIQVTSIQMNKQKGFASPEGKYKSKIFSQQPQNSTLLQSYNYQPLKENKNKSQDIISSQGFVSNRQANSLASRMPQQQKLTASSVQINHITKQQQQLQQKLQDEYKQMNQKEIEEHKKREKELQQQLEIQQQIQKELKAQQDEQIQKLNLTEQEKEQMQQEFLKQQQLQQQAQQEYERKIQQLEQDLKGALEEKFELSNENQGLKQKNELIAAQQQDINQNRDNLSNDESARQLELEYTDKYLKLQQEHMIQQDQLKQEQEQKQKILDQMNKLQEQIQELNGNLNKELTEKKKNQNQTNKRIDQQQQEILKLKSQLTNNNTTNEQIQQKQAELNQLKTKLKQIEKSKDSLIDSKNTELHKLKENMTQTQYTAQLAKQNNERTIQKIEGNNQRIEDLNAKIKEMESQKVKLEQQYGKIQEDYDKQGTEMHLKDNQIQQLVQELSLTKQLQQESELNSKKLQELQKENEKLRETCNLLENKNKQLDEDFMQSERQKQNYLEEQIQMLKQENASIQESYYEYKNKKEQEIQENQQNLGQIQNEREKLKDQIQELRNELEQSKQGMQTDIVSQQDLLKKLQEQLVQYQKENLALQDNQRKLEEEFKQKETDFIKQQKENELRQKEVQQQSQKSSPSKKQKIFEEFRPSTGQQQKQQLQQQGEGSYFSSEQKMPQQEIAQKNQQFQEQEQQQIAGKAAAPSLNQQNQAAPTQQLRNQNELDQEEGQPQIKLSELLQMQKTGQLKSKTNRGDLLGPNIVQQTPNALYQTQFVQEQQIGQSYHQDLNNYLSQKNMNTIQQIDPVTADLIYPFQNPVNYFENKVNRDPKGKLVKFQYDFFKNQLPSDQRGLHRFKRSAIHQNEFLTLFQNENVKVQCQTSYMTEQKFFLGINLIFTNIGQGLIQNFSASYIGNSESIQVFSSPSQLQSQLQSGASIQQDLQINFAEIPYNILILELEFQAGSKKKRFSVALPHTINQYLEQQQISVSDFKKQWKQGQENIIRSEEYILETKLVGSAYDFLRIFPNFFEINENKARDYNLGISENRVGGYMFLRHTNTALLGKITVFPNNKVIFQMSFLNSQDIALHRKTAEFVLNTFVLVFTDQVQKLQGNSSLPLSQVHNAQGQIISGNFNRNSPQQVTTNRYY